MISGDSIVLKSTLVMCVCLAEFRKAYILITGKKYGKPRLSLLWKRYEWSCTVWALLEAA